VERPIGRQILKWDVDNKINLKEIGYYDLQWVYLAQDADEGRNLVTRIMKLRSPFKVGNFLAS
jgi:hypothetical protein